MSEPCDHHPCTPECEADLSGHYVFDGWCAKPDKHSSNCVCGDRGSKLLPGLCYCAVGDAHFTDPDKRFGRVISITRKEGL